MDWVIVPRSPTKKMLAAFRPAATKAYHSVEKHTGRSVAARVAGYQAMIAAAPRLRAEFLDRPLRDFKPK